MHVHALPHMQGLTSAHVTMLNRKDLGIRDLHVGWFVCTIRRVGPDSSLSDSRSTVDTNRETQYYDMHLRSCVELHVYFFVGNLRNRFILSL
jgi:hypothetical protein